MIKQFIKKILIKLRIIKKRKPALITAVKPLGHTPSVLKNTPEGVYPVRNKDYMRNKAKYESFSQQYGNARQPARNDFDTTGLVLDVAYLSVLDNLSRAYSGDESTRSSSKDESDWGVQIPKEDYAIPAKEHSVEIARTPTESLAPSYSNTSSFSDTPSYSSDTSSFTESISSIFD